jgi:hypothetical protein
VWSAVISEADVAGVHGGDVDVGPEGLGAQALGQVGEAALGGRIDRRAAAQAADRGERGDDDEVPAPLRAKVLHRGLDLGERCDEVRLHDRAVAREVAGPDRLARADAGVDDHAIERRVLGEHPEHRVVIGDVQRRDVDAAGRVLGADLVAQLFEALDAPGGERGRGRARRTGAPSRRRGRRWRR